MKMQSKLLVVSLTPLLIIGVLVCVLSGIKINTVVTGTIENGLKGVATAVRDTLWNTDKNSDYRITEDGELYKGDFYVSGGITIVDNIKRATGMEVIIFYKDTFCCGRKRKANCGYEGCRQHRIGSIKKKRRLFLDGR